MDLYWNLKVYCAFECEKFCFLACISTWYSSAVADSSVVYAWFMLVSDGSTNNLNEHIMMSVEDVVDLENMVHDVYYNERGVVVNETIFPKFFAHLPGPHP